jgi:hypothetical protein
MPPPAITLWSSFLTTQQPVTVSEPSLRMAPPSPFRLELPRGLWATPSPLVIIRLRSVTWASGAISKMREKSLPSIVA